MLVGFLDPLCIGMGTIMCITRTLHKVKTLWMIVHHKPYLFASRLIPLGMLQRLTFEKVHGKNMNWALYAKWTNNEQHWRKATVKQIEFLSDEDEGETSLEYKV